MDLSFIGQTKTDLSILKKSCRKSYSADKCKTQHMQNKRES